MPTSNAEELEQSERIVTNIFRYVYWVCLDKKTATQVVCSTLKRFPQQSLRKIKSDERKKLDVLRFLQSECAKNSVASSNSYRATFTNYFEKKNFHASSHQNVQMLRAKLRRISEIDRAIFVLIYLWEIDLEQAAEILKISPEQVRNGFDSTLNNLQAVLPGN